MKGARRVRGTSPSTHPADSRPRDIRLAPPGVGQVIEVFHQLRGEAGDRQLEIPDLRLGLTHNVGGTGGTCVVNILGREE